MANTHSPSAGVSAAELRRHRRALRIMVVVLIPLAVWTVAGLIVLWPHDAASHVAQESNGYTVAGTTYPTGRITAINEISCEGAAGSTPGVNNQTCATIAVQLQEGPDQGQTVEVPLTDALYGSGTEIGQQVKLVRLPAVDDQPPSYQFSDFERSTPLLVLSLVFVVLVVLVARWRGFASLVGLGFAGFILVKFMFPALVAGANPIMVGLIGSSAIMFVVLYAAHGFSARTTTALVGTLFGLILIALLGWGATRWAHLTGVAAEDDYVLAAAAPNLSLTSVVMCGIIVAGLGVLNDVTITQASAVWELADEGGRDRAGQRRLFSRAMRIGRDHIASTVYTIAFATAGASLSVLLLIAVYNRPLLQVLQTEQFAGEIVRTLVGSIGLVLAVPLTTAVGVAVVRASSAGGGRRREPVAEEPFEDLEPALGSQATTDDSSRPAARPTADAGPDAAASGTAVPASGNAGTADQATGNLPQATGNGDESKDGRPGPSEPVGVRRRWRRGKDDDDFGFSDLRDPDGTDAGPRGPRGPRGR